MTGIVSRFIASPSRKMARNPMQRRREQYFEISSSIAQLNDMQLRSLLDKSESSESSAGWGLNQIISVGQSQVFVKRVPVTDREYGNLFSTSNLYNLPTSYNYGFGSLGFGVWRELITHIKTTHWVLAGEIPNFPLMYHYRIVPAVGQQVDMDLAQWGNHPNVRRYVLDRAIANRELVLFLEYIPHVLETWLISNPNRLQQALGDLRRAIDFLRAKGIIHFDTHFRNVLTDGQQAYLADFGLVLDKSFALTKDEEAFFEKNRFYDYGEVLRNWGHLIRAPYTACSETEKRRILKKYGIKEGSKPHEIGAALLDNIEQIDADKDLALEAFYVSSIVKYRSIIALMQSFFVDMWGNERRDTEFPHAELEQLLKETGFLSDAFLEE